MFKVLKRKLDQEALNELRSEIQTWTLRSLDFATPQIQRLIQVLDKKREETIRNFTTKDINSFDNDLQSILFMASARAILQTIDGLESLYAGAEQKRKELSDELARILPE